MQQISDIASRQLTDEQLMQLISKGQKKALEVIYDRYFDKLVRFAMSFLNDEAKAEDVVQETFIRIIEKHNLFDQEKKFSTWIYTITGNNCKQVLRNEKNRLRILKEEVMGHGANSGIMHLESDHKFLQQKIKVIYATLSEKEKNIYTLRFENEMSIKEIAEVICIPEGSVKSGIYYLLKKFALHLKEFTHEK